MLDCQGFFYGIHLHALAWGQDLRWWLVVIVLVDTEWSFAHQDPDILDVSVRIFGEWEDGPWIR